MLFSRRLTTFQCALSATADAVPCAFSHAGQRLTAVPPTQSRLNRNALLHRDGVRRSFGGHLCRRRRRSRVTRRILLRGPNASCHARSNDGRGVQGTGRRRTSPGSEFDGAKEVKRGNKNLKKRKSYSHKKKNSRNPTKSRRGVNNKISHVGPVFDRRRRRH